MSIARVRSNVIGVVRLCAKYVNTASEVKFHVQSGTDETKNKAPLWKPVEAWKIGLKSCSTRNDLAKGLFSWSAQKRLSKSNQNNLKTRSALASSQFTMTVLPVVTGFLYRLRTQTIIRQKVYCFVYYWSKFCFFFHSSVSQSVRFLFLLWCYSCGKVTFGTSDRSLTSRFEFVFVQPVTRQHFLWESILYFIPWQNHS